VVGRAAGDVLGGVPVLVATPQHRADAPVVLWFHGFRADALAHARELEQCAAMGWIAIGVDAVGHGSRRDPGLDARVSREGALPVLREQIEATIDELTALLSDAARRFRVDRARTSMVGVSMGAMLIYRAMTRAVPMRAAVALLGTPDWPGGSLGDVRRDDVALLSITAEHDVNVAPEGVTELHATYDAIRAPAPHAHRILRGVGHLTPAPAWHEAMEATRAWLSRYG
jgi:uncharacterized protein